MSVFLVLDSKDGNKSFYTVQEEKIEQAERSVLISCPAKTNEKKFLSYLSRHGDINKCFFYESYVSISVVLRCESTNKHSEISK
uniref:PolyA RNA polymerase, mitochondrial n=1 Tax=Oncorhynchus mykiss TaxID=8022 RepID=C1BER3_ONCMY|nr:PolyA RNA polymerase, mitochondrial precursor [Oncorhynchus mykiss]